MPTLSFDVIFDVAPPRHVSSTTSGGAVVFEAGQTVTITTRWDGSGYVIAADFSHVDSEFDPADVVVTETTTAGRYTVVYEISEANSFVPVTDAPVVITATDSFSRSTSDTTVAVSVLPATPGGLTGLGVDVNSFRPLLGERAVVSPGSYAGTATVSVYNMAGTLVRTLDERRRRRRSAGTATTTTADWSPAACTSSGSRRATVNRSGKWPSSDSEQPWRVQHEVE